MKKGKKLYLKLFTSTFLISAFTFGGGYVIVPLMKKKFVNDYNWIDEEEMLNLIAIAQSTPGAIAINTSIVIGYKLCGIIGAVITLLATILPPLIIISIISSFYLFFKQNIYVNRILKGMQVGVAAVIVDVLIGMIFDIKKQNDTLLLIIMIAAFIATYYLNIIVIIILCAALGLFFRKENNNGRKEV